MATPDKVRHLKNTRTGTIHRWTQALAKRKHMRPATEDDLRGKLSQPELWVNRWKGETVAIIASGPSLTSDQVAAIELAHRAGKCKVIAVNNNILKAPFSDVMYARDWDWWVGYAGQWKAFTGEKWTGDRRASVQFDLKYVPERKGRGLCRSRGRIHSGKNSGHQAMGLAYWFGVSRMLLVGFDMQSTNGETHWFGKHKGDLNNPTQGGMKAWRGYMEDLANDLETEHIEVINCSKQTALTCFKRGDITTELEGL